MKWHRKINRGAALALLLLIGIVVYLSWLAAARRDDLPVIRERASSYVQAELGWTMLPEAYRSASPDVPDAELASYAAQQEQVIRSWYIDHDAITDPLVRRMREGLETQAAGRDVILDYTKEILEVRSIVFEGDRATVMLRTRTSLEIAGRDGVFNEEMYDDTVILQRDGDGWAVVYAALRMPYSWQYEKDFTGGMPPEVYK